MKLKKSHIVTLSVTGILILFIGDFRKITHQPDAGIFTKTGYCLLAVAALLALLKAVLPASGRHRTRNH